MAEYRRLRRHQRYVQFHTYIKRSFPNAHLTDFAFSHFTVYIYLSVSPTSNGFVLGEDPRTTWVTAASREYFSAVIRNGNLGAVKKKKDIYTSLNQGKPFT